jgi:hypothetical protein
MIKLIKGLAQPGQGNAGVVQLARCVFWSFFGVRKGHDLEGDAANISPMQVIVAGLFGTVVFHLALFAVVSFIASSQNLAERREMSELRELSFSVVSTDADRRQDAENLGY